MKSQKMKVEWDVEGHLRNLQKTQVPSSSPAMVLVLVWVGPSYREVHKAMLVC
jgi:hypothetical protein